MRQGWSGRALPGLSPRRYQRNHLFTRHVLIVPEPSGSMSTLSHAGGQVLIAPRQWRECLPANGVSSHKTLMRAVRHRSWTYTAYLVVTHALPRFREVRCSCRPRRCEQFARNQGAGSLLTFAVRAEADSATSLPTWAATRIATRRRRNASGRHCCRWRRLPATSPRRTCHGSAPS
jgi:hypothetical protein